MPRREDSILGAEPEAVHPMPERRDYSRAKKDGPLDNALGVFGIIGVSWYVLANWRDMPDWVQIGFVVFAGMAVLVTPMWCYRGFRYMQYRFFPKAYARYVARCEEKERRQWDVVMRKAAARDALDKAVHPWLQRMLWFIAIMLALLVAHFVFHLI